MKNFGIYIHVPFCESKCPYCDFYSRPPKGSGKTKEEYVREYTAGVKVGLFLMPKSTGSEKSTPSISAAVRRVFWEKTHFVRFYLRLNHVFV